MTDNATLEAVKAAIREKVRSALWIHPTKGGEIDEGDVDGFTEEIAQAAIDAITDHFVRSSRKGVIYE